MRFLAMTTSAPFLEAILRVLSVEWPSVTMMAGLYLLCLACSILDFMVAASFLVGKMSTTFEDISDEGFGLPIIYLSTLKLYKKLIAKLFSF